MDLFSQSNAEIEAKIAPLAERMRPKTLDDFVGQPHLLGKNQPLRAAIEHGTLGSAIFWGTPGCGKTTLAHIIATRTDAEYAELSAVIAGVKEVREVIERAKGLLRLNGKRTLLFVDEIHRFNKAQQDAFLPHVERGTIMLIGATTENPGFEVNAPLISRMKVYHFDPLSTEDVVTLLGHAQTLYPKHTFDPKAIHHMAQQANGDARSAYNAMELATELGRKITLATAESASQRKALYYDKKGDNHYDTISAFIKSMRGGSVDGAMYYMARMLKAGEDPMFIARRMVIFASEDIANADPFAIVLATNIMQAVHMIGMPEAQLVLAQSVAYLSNAPKSTAPMDALFAAYHDIDAEPIAPVPIHLRNAVNKVMKELGAGQGYIRYEHQNQKKFKKQQFLPDVIKHHTYYDASADRQPKSKQPSS
jgi:putative ATPase